MFVAAPGRDDLLREREEANPLGTYHPLSRCSNTKLGNREEIIDTGPKWSHTSACWPGGTFVDESRGNPMFPGARKARFRTSWGGRPGPGDGRGGGGKLESRTASAPLRPSDPSLGVSESEAGGLGGGNPPERGALGQNHQNSDDP